jgi:hypothetical protein
MPPPVNLGGGMAAYLDRAAPLLRVGAPDRDQAVGFAGCVGEPCSDFPTVVRAFITIVNAEVARAREAIPTFDRHGRPGRIDFLTIAERTTIVEGWLIVWYLAVTIPPLQRPSKPSSPGSPGRRRCGGVMASIHSSGSAAASSTSSGPTRAIRESTGTTA